MPEKPNPKIRQTPTPPHPAEMDAACPYAELDVATNFSFLRGASHGDELVFRAGELGYRAIGVTDVNTLAGVVRAHEAAKQCGLKLVVGVRLQLVDAPDVLIWPTDRVAYGRLCRLLTTGKRRTEKGQCTLYLEDVLNLGEGMQAAVVPADPRSGEDATVAYAKLRQALERRVSIAASRVYGPDDQSHLARLAELSRKFDIPLLATNQVHYHDPARRRLQDVLTCVRHGRTIGEAGFRLLCNGERYLKPPDAMYRLFADHPAALRRGLEIAEQCQFNLDELRYEYPDEIVPTGQSAIAYLADLTWRGAAQRWSGGVPVKVRGQIEHELELIERLKYEAYFLTVHDMVVFARSRGILCQGRGSAANSAVCYCIGVTSVDPSRIDVLFERFVSAARGEPPDIDVDFEHERREEVLQYLYNKYGRERAGMTAEVITYRGKSAVRDVGTALGLSLDMVDQMSKRLEWWDRGALSEQQLIECGLDPADRTVRLVVELTAQLLGFPRHLSQHVGGMVMTRGPLCEMVPIENAAMADRTVIEWDKNDIDALGILKVDALALGMLTCISKAFALVEHKTGFTAENAEIAENARKNSIGNSFLEDGVGKALPPTGNFSGVSSAFSAFSAVNSSSPRRLELHTVPPEDPVVYEMISNADTIGVFQIESRAQMSMLPRLRPRCFYDLVIEVAIVRPGPIQGDMVHPYLRRRNNEEAVSYPSEALRNVLSKTLGVPLFQEQAMRIVMVAAGFTAEEADKLRRAMAAWKRGGAIDVFHKKIVEGMLANGYTAEFANQCFMQIRGFGEYGFPESHAASFALLVYVSAWLKRYHPAAFAAALINSQPMGFYAPAQIVRDAREHGVTVKAVDVNESDWDCLLDRPAATPPPPVANTAPGTWGQGGPELRLGLRLVRGLRRVHAEKLLEARARVGRFASVSHLHRAAGLPVSALKVLAEADTFGSMGLSRRRALWEVLALADESAPLFDRPELSESESESEEEPVLLPLPQMPLGQEVMHDYLTVGLSLKRHPVGVIRQELARLGLATCAQVQAARHGDWVKAAGVVLIRQRPGTAGGIVFQTIEDETGIANLIVRPEIYDQFRQAARHATLIRVEGRVERQGQVVHVTARKLDDLSEMLAGFQGKSRNFH